MLAWLLLAALAFRTDAWLASQYAEYNQAYFQDSLPKSAKVRWGHMNDFMGHVDVFGPQVYILIDRGTNTAPRVAKGTLLHEMCHVERHVKGENPASHGDEFQACMLRLAQAGAFKEIW